MLDGSRRRSVTVHAADAGVARGRPAAAGAVSAAGTSAGPGSVLACLALEAWKSAICSSDAGFWCRFFHCGYGSP